MDFPSGDQANGDDGGPGGWLLRRLQAPWGRRRAVPPLAGTIQTCDGAGAAELGKATPPPPEATPRNALPLLFSGTAGLAKAPPPPTGGPADFSTPGPARLDRR